GAVGLIAAAGVSVFAGAAQKLAPLAADAVRLRANVTPLGAARLAWDSVLVAGVIAQYLFPVLALVIVGCHARATRWTATDAALLSLFGVWALLHFPKASIGSSAMSHWTHVTTPLFFVFAIVWRDH